MAMLKPVLLGSCLVAASALAQTPDAAEQSRVLVAIRDYALNYTNRLPNFTCTQVTRRTHFPVMAFRSQPITDSFEEQVTFVDHKESYTVMKVNGEAPASAAHDQIEGFHSRGEFGTLLAHTLDPNTGTEFHWERSAKQKGQKVYVFAFRVPQTKGYSLVGMKGTVVVAYKGLLYADSQTGEVLHVEMQCDIPKDSEYRQLELVLDFKRTEVAGHEFLLPSHYHLHSINEVPDIAANKTVSTRSGPILSETTNEVDYKAYRRFDTDSRITFGGEANPEQ